MPEQPRKQEAGIERFVLKTQGWITFALFVCFIGMLGLSLWIVFKSNGDIENVTNSFLPIVTGWIGVVLGFYFSREISGMIENRLKSVKSEADETMKSQENKIAELEKKRIDEVEETKREFKEILDKKSKQIKELKNMSERLLSRVNLYRDIAIKRNKGRHNHGRN